MEPTIVCRFCEQEIGHLKGCPTILREVNNLNLPKCECHSCTQARIEMGRGMLGGYR